MRAAALRYANGQTTRLPYRVTRQLIAAQLGQLPETIDAMPADDFMDAAALAPIAKLVTIGGSSE